MKNIQRFLCMVLCLTVFAAFVASSVLAFVGCHHSCQEEECSICAEVSQLRRNGTTDFKPNGYGRLEDFACGSHTALTNHPVAPESNTLHDLGVMLTI